MVYEPIKNNKRCQNCLKKKSNFHVFRNYGNEFVYHKIINEVNSINRMTCIYYDTHHETKNKKTFFCKECAIKIMLLERLIEE